MAAKKVVLIGAGSVEFTTGLIADFIADGGEWELRLVDIDESNLDVGYRLAQRMVQERSAPVTLKRSTERRELLPGADAVITCIAVGGRSAWVNDIEIPRKHGIYMAVADTTTPGGFSRSLRILPALVDISRDIEALAPGARFLNYSNPMAAIVRAVTISTKIPVYGMCHGVPDARRYMAEFLNVPVEDCEAVAVGFNHFLWFLSFKVGGRDAHPLIREKNAELMRQGKPAGNSPDFPLSWELFDLFGYFPMSRDRHIAEFFPQFHADGSHYGKTLGIDRFSFEELIERSEARYERMKQVASGELSVPATFYHSYVGEGEEALLVLQAFDSREARRFHVTLPNTVQVENLSKDYCVESPVDFSAEGVAPVRLGRIPTGLKANIDKAFLTTDLIIEAALERDRGKFVQAIVLDGCVTSIAQANTLADELLSANREWLPGW